MLTASMTSTTFGLAQSLAESALYLKGPDARAFSEQFSSLAKRPVTTRVAGDGETFRHALCFPVCGSAQGDLIHVVPGTAPLLVVELRTGHIVALRLADNTSDRLSLSTFLRGIERNLDRLPLGQSAWAGIQKSIEMMQRRRIVLLDFVLTTDAPTFWREFFPKGEAYFANSLFRGLPPTTGPGRKKAMVALLDIQSEYYRRASADFLAHLDEDVIQAVCASGRAPTVAQYNTYRRGEPTAARYRIQAAEAVPLLGYMLGEENHRATRLRRLVDAGQPLWPALADTVGVPEETVRWLRGKTADDVSDAWLGRIPELLTSLAHLPPEKRPKTRDDWTAYTDFALVIDRPRTNPRHARWLQDLGRLGWVAARQKFEAMQATPSDLSEIADLLHELIGAVGGELLPHVARRWRYEREGDDEWQRLTSALETVFFHSSILKQLRASLRWHALQLLPLEEDAPAADEASTQESTSRPDCWPSPLKEPLKVGGLHAHFLTTPTQLRDEGLRMEHCVGSYADRCLFDGSNIVSFRKGDGRSVSTAELRLVERGKRLGFDVTQHQAQRNGDPSPEALQALSSLLRAFDSDEMQTRLKEMREQLRQRQALDDRRSEWMDELPTAPHRLRALKAALKLHVGYERLLEAGRKAIE